MKIELENAVVYQGSNLDVLPTLPDNSVDSIVTDPPYELGFMGKSWDNSGIAYSVELWAECMRVLKPGGHLLAFGGSRTWHRVAVAIEDAGFEMRDSIAWLYGSGFPKSMDISKQIDKQAGVQRIVETETVSDLLGEREVVRTKMSGIANKDEKDRHTIGASTAVQIDITSLATPEAQKWQGWGTALKPAFEPIVVARKPLEEKTVAANVLKFGTGGINIDGSRIGTGTGETKTVRYPDMRGGNYGQDAESYAERNTVEREVKDQGRWPANIILDPYTAELLDEQSGISISTFSKRGLQVSGQSGGLGGEQPNYKTGTNSERGHNDTGGASRFFYVAKANRRDRNEGLEHLEGKANRINAPRNSEEDKHSTTKQNFHPTVKPTALMEYLIKLVTPSGGKVLDPFTGSGSTGKAALLNGYQFIGIELTEEYLPIIEARLRAAQESLEKTKLEAEEVLF